MAQKINRDNGAVEKVRSSLLKKLMTIDLRAGVILDDLKMLLRALKNTGFLVAQQSA